VTVAASTAHVAYVGLGSNLEDPVAQLRRTLAALGELPGTRLRSASGLYRTPPWGLLEQPEFVNAVAELHTTLGVRSLLEALQSLERAAGRAREQRWGPRVLDLDLLLYDALQLDEPGLHLPHPRLHERAFVLVPLAEIAPGLQVPGRGAVAALLAAVDRAGIQALG
jgi:2-amino-4-hydroxy-6-hydroxymethyldihydropteridine diphosphokinase